MLHFCSCVGPTFSYIPRYRFIKERYGNNATTFWEFTSSIRHVSFFLTNTVARLRQYASVSLDSTIHCNPYLVHAFSTFMCISTWFALISEDSHSHIRRHWFHTTWLKNPVLWPTAVNADAAMASTPVKIFEVGLYNKSHFIVKQCKEIKCNGVLGWLWCSIYRLRYLWYYNSFQM